MERQTPFKMLLTQSSRHWLKLVFFFLLFGTILAFLYNMTRRYAQHGHNPNEGSYQVQHQADLLPSGFDRPSCYSRYDLLLTQRSKMRKPSLYLISKLRSYEARHKRCAPYTFLYNMTIHSLKINMSSGALFECKYVIWLPVDGLGNRILSLASTFLYALLTDRVLLVDPKDAISDLFCEPFPEGSWLLPLDFPLAHKLSGFNKDSEECFGKLLGNKLLGNSSISTPPQLYVYIHLYINFGDLDKRFFCDEDQSYVTDVPWLMMFSDLYFAPSFFSMSCFEKELDNLFPDKETVFHFLAQYLFHPTNSVWGLVSSFYKTYLLGFDVKLGVQIRNFDFENIPTQDIVNQILSCTMSNGLLPRNEPVNLTEPMMKKNGKRIVVLLASLSRDYFEEIRKLYLENAPTTGEIVAIEQASFEVKQATGNRDHDRKALAEIYLLSLADELVTSALSTFGYAAQGIGGLTPRMIFKSKNQTGHDRPCERVVSMEPCYLIPPRYDCKMKRVIDESVIRHTRPCADNYWGGVKLVNDHTNAS